MLVKGSNCYKRNTAVHKMSVSRLVPGDTLPPANVFRPITELQNTNGYHSISFNLCRGRRQILGFTRAGGY